VLQCVAVCCSCTLLGGLAVHERVGARDEDGAGDSVACQF